MDQALQELPLVQEIQEEAKAGATDYAVPMHTSKYLQLGQLETLFLASRCSPAIYFYLLLHFQSFLLPAPIGSGPEQGERDVWVVSLEDVQVQKHLSSSAADR